MTKRILSEEEVLETLFNSSDEEELAGLHFEADHVQEDLHDAQTWQIEEREAQEAVVEMEDYFEEEHVNYATLQAVSLQGRVADGAEAGPRPSYTTLVPPPPPSSPLPMPGTSSEPSPVPSSEPSPVPSVTSPVPSAASTDGPPLSLAEVRSRKRRRGPLRPAEGKCLTKLPQPFYKAKDLTTTATVGKFQK